MAEGHGDSAPQGALKVALSGTLDRESVFVGRGLAVHMSEIGLFPIFVPEGKPRNRDMRLKRKCLDALNAMQKTLALNKQLFLKKIKKTNKNFKKITKFA